MFQIEIIVDYSIDIIVFLEKRGQVSKDRFCIKERRKSMKKLLLFLLLAGTVQLDGKNEQAASGMIHLFKSEKLEKILKENDRVLVKFSASWCAACKSMKDLDGKMHRTHQRKMAFVEVDSDKAAELSKTYSVQGVPTYIFFKKGKEVSRKVGTMSKSEYESLLK